MNVIWLASWFPNRTDPSNGDFVERHAQAVAPFLKKLTIISVVKDASMPVNAVETVVQRYGNIEVHIVYYGKSSWDGAAEKFLSFRKNTSLYQRVFNEITAESQLPDLLHVHVAMKAGLFAKRVRKKLGIPYIITEHWSGYKRISKPNIYNHGKIFVALTKSVLRNASVLLPVSNDLGNTITRDFVKMPVSVVPNVVNTEYFFCADLSQGIFTFIHPSYMNHPKNPEGIIKACYLLKEKGYKFQLKVAGSRNKEIVQYSRELQLLDTEVFFEEAIPYADVAKRMQQSNALLMFSHYENLPCIILEALCCGLPVVSSKVGGIPEIITDKNGILVQKDNVEELVKAMQYVIDNYASFNRESIAHEASNTYSYDVIGKKIVETYSAIINKN